MADCRPPTTSTKSNTATSTTTTNTGTGSTSETCSTTTSIATTLPVPQRIIDTILADINAVMPNYQILVSSYRLLVGSAEEIQRTPAIPREIFERAVLRMDNAGTLIDIFLDLLLCKISFSSDFLSVTCAPVDLFRLLATCNPVCDTPHRTSEQILQLEVLRRALDKYRKGSGPGPRPDSGSTENSKGHNVTSPPVTPGNQTKAKTKTESATENSQNQANNTTTKIRPTAPQKPETKSPYRWTFPVEKSDIKKSAAPKSPPTSN